MSLLLISAVVIALFCSVCVRKFVNFKMLKKLLSKVEKAIWKIIFKVL